MEENDGQGLPSEIIIASKKPKKGAKITMLGHKKKLKWEYHKDGFKVSIPASLSSAPPGNYAWTIKVSAIVK